MTESNAALQILVIVVLVCPRHVPPVYGAYKEYFLYHLEEPDIQGVEENKEVGGGDGKASEGGEEGEEDRVAVEHHGDVEEVRKELTEGRVGCT